MNSLDLVEKRISHLSNVIGLDCNSDYSTNELSRTSLSAQSLVESLLSAQDLLSTASKTNISMNNVLERAPELESYLDADFIDCNQKVLSKEVYLNAIAPDLHSVFGQFEKIKSLEPTLGAEYFRSIPIENTNKLEKILVDNSEFSQQTDLIEESLILAMKRYGEIQSDLLLSLQNLNGRLDEIEAKSLKKKQEQIQQDF